MSDSLLNVKDVADRLGCSPRSVWKLSASGRLPSIVRLGRSVKWRASDIERFIKMGCPDRETLEAEKSAAE